MIKRSSMNAVSTRAVLTNVTAAQRFKDGKMLVTATLPAKGRYMAASAEKRKLRQKRQRKEYFVLHDENTLETPWYIVSWNELGELTSLMIRRQSVKF